MLLPMDGRLDSVETTTSFVWIDDGIVHIETKGTPRTADSVSTTFGAVRDLLGTARMPALLDLRKRLPSDQDSWAIFIKNAQMFSAAAFVIDPDVHPRVDVYPEIINRMLIPFQVFTTEAEALAFLAAHKTP